MKNSFRANFSCPLPTSPSDPDHSFRALAEIIPGMVFSARPDGTLDYFNSSWRDFVGTPPEKNASLKWHEFVHPDDLDSLFAAWQKSVADRTHFEEEFRLKRADGHYQWFLARVVPIISAQGELIKWHGVSTNIDDQKKAVTELERIGELKDEFVAILGHELRNPLAAIRASFEVVRGSASTPENKEKAVALLGNQISHLSRLVDDTLDISRLSAKKLRLITGPVELNQLTETCCASYQKSAAEAGLSLHCETDGPPVWVNGDDVRLSQCLTNLLQNAFKFTEPGGSVTVHVRASGARARINVTDTGIGMTGGEIARIFQPFEQGRGVSELSVAGLGLGLAVTNHLVNLHGGQIKAESPGKGRGATFTFEVPLSSAPDLPLKSVPEIRDDSSKKILLIEDNESVAQSLQLFFEMEGHHVDFVHSGNEAFEKLKETHPDIVISDLTLPGGLNGWEVAEKIIASYPENKRPYLVALSGNNQPHHRAKSKNAGFDSHLSKPPTPEMLRTVLSIAQNPNEV